MRNLVANISSLTNDANGVFADQTLADAGALDLDGALVVGGVAYVGLQGLYRTGQQISIEGTGNNSGVDATITGTDADGTVISEVLTLANNGTVLSVLYYNTITSITVDGALTGNIEGGPLATNGAVSRSLRHNGQQMNFKISYVSLITGTLTYSAQYCLDQPEDEYAVSYSASADWNNVDGMTALTASADTNVFYKINCSRLLITAYTSGTAKLTCGQSY
jgi:hypothetical protein